jgi:hypothetical protein
MNFNTTPRSLLAALLAVAATGEIAISAPVTIPDYSFENTPLAPGGTTVNPYVGTNWTAAQGVYLQNITNTLFTPTSSNTLPPTAQGTNYLVEDINGHICWCWQDIGPLQSNTIYTLTIAVGQSLLGNTGQGFIGLVNGTIPFQTLLAATPVDNSLLTAGTFADSTLVFTTGYKVSGDLTILMEGTNGAELCFDNVRLDASPAPQSPTALLPSLSSPSNTVYVGTVVTLSEDPAGASSFTYQWQVNTGTGFTSVANANSANYVVNTSSTTPGSSAEYQVIVSNNFGVSTSPPVTLTVIEGQPVIIQDTLPSWGYDNGTPVTSSDVVGSQVTFSALFDGSRPLTYQWQVDYGSGPGPIAGATNTTLTLTNLQLTNTGTYSLVASNSFGPVSSTPSPYTVNPVPAPVNGVIISTANQYGLGGQTEFSPSFLIAPDSLIAGELPSSSTGNFEILGCGGVSHLTDGIFGTLYPSGNTSPDLASAGNSVTGNSGCGTVLVYTLPPSTYGYDLTNITVYGGWSDGGRDQQSYDVYYSSIASPSNFNNLLTQVNYLPSPTTPADQSATRVSITSANAGGVLLHNVAAVEFWFWIQQPGFNENGYQGYAELQIFGAPSASLPPILTTNTLPVSGSDVVGSQVTFVVGASSPTSLSYQWQVDTGSGPQPVTGATNTTLTLANLQLTNTGSYSCVVSNSAGVVTSTPNSFVVYPDNGPDGNNVVEAPANQTGSGPLFTPTWTIAPGSLIAGMLPTAVVPSANSFSAENAGGLPILTDGQFGFTGSGDNATMATCGQNAGQILTYTLTGSEGGYDITNIALYGGWSDGGRDEQAYTIYYSTVTAPTTFIELTAYDYAFAPLLPGAVPNANRVTYTSGNGPGTPLATNVGAVQFNFTTPNGGGENGYEGYAEIDVYGSPSASVALPPVLVSDTLPSTGADVVGGQVSFTAAFSSSAPMVYQWYQNTGSGAVALANATSTTLTLSNLQLTNTGSYNLVASNALGVAASTPNSFIVNPAPTATNGFVTADANQTWLGVSFTPTWPVPPGSLIAGSLPTTVGTGNFKDGYCGGVPVLTDGKIGPIGGNDNLALASCGSSDGKSVTYTLTGSATGYDLTKIITYGGWNDSGRDQQDYTIYYSTVTAPSTFIELTAVSIPSPTTAAVPNSTRATLTSASGGPLASHVAAVEFNFTTPNGGGENGWEGYTELSLYGAASPLAPPTITAPAVSAGNLVLAGTGGTPGGSYTWLTSTNLAAPLATWATNSTGVFDGTGAFSNAIPIIASQPGRFFVLRVP